MQRLSLRTVRRALDGYPRSRVPLGRFMRKAAVAAILRDTSAGAELLFIHRAEHPKDPWSGHMGFPGGRVDPADPDPMAAAVRETREEIDLDLAAAAEPVGRLSDVPAIALGRPIPMVIVPFVFALTDEERPSLTPNHEVQEALWVPLAFFDDPGNRKPLDKRLAGVPIRLPCYRYEGRVIWGLTLRMVDELMARVRHGGA